MKKYSSILTIFIVLLFTACSEKTNKINIPAGYSNLRIVLDDSSHFYPASIWVKNTDSTLKLHIDFDSTISGRIYSIDSLRNNEYTIIINSLLNAKTSIPFTLVKDSLIYIDNNDLTRFHDTASPQDILAEFKRTDSLCIAYYSSGCFHNYSSQILVCKKGNTFKLDYSIDTSHGMTPQIFSVTKLFPLSFEDTLKKLFFYCDSGFAKQLELKKVYEEILKEDTTGGLRASIFWYGSTTYSEIYFSTGKTFFCLTNNGINEIPYYYEFMKSLNLFPKKSGS